MRRKYYVRLEVTLCGNVVIHTPVFVNENSIGMVTVVVVVVGCRGVTDFSATTS